MIAGIFKGLISSFISIVRGIAAILGAIFLAKPLANIIIETSLGNQIISIVNDWLVGINKAAFDMFIPSENQVEAISLAIKELGIPDTFNKVLAEVAVKFVTLEGG